VIILAGLGSKEITGSKGKKTTQLLEKTIIKIGAIFF
jgi:hypothetical protein